MRTKTTIFAIPTNRLRDVAETVEIYDRHFWSSGHSVKIMIFDDSTVGNYEKYYAKLEQTKTVNDLYYIGPRKRGIHSVPESQIAGPQARVFG